MTAEEFRDEWEQNAERWTRARTGQEEDYIALIHLQQAQLKETVLFILEQLEDN